MSGNVAIEAMAYEIPTHRVLSSWIEEQISDTMERLGVETFIEFGPGNVLSGLVKRTLENAVTLNVRNSGECRALAELLKGGR